MRVIDNVKYKKSVFYVMELSTGHFVDIQIGQMGRIIVMKNGDGSRAYGYGRDETFPDYPVNEELITEYMKEYLHGKI